MRKDVDKTAIPVIRPISLSEAGSLPEFKIAPSHTLHGHTDPFMGFDSGFKFFLLRKLGNDFVQGFGEGTLFHDEEKLNQLACAVTTLNSTLVSFGFISNLAKIQQLMPTLVKVSLFK